VVRHIDRRRIQIALRAGALAFVVMWLFSRRLQELVPYLLPFALLVVAEAEFLVRSRQGRRATESASEAPLDGRRLPGSEDADLGWGRLVETHDGDVIYVPPPPRPPSRRGPRLLAIAGVGVAVALFVLAARVDRTRTWEVLPAETRARAAALFTHEAERIAGRPVTVRCDEDYTYTGIGSDALGVAFQRRALAFLEPDVCRALTSLAFDGDRRERQETAEAVLVLAHEAVHLSGERDEGLTECKALQEGVRLGVRLGLGQSRARRMMASLYARNLAERSITRLSYRLPEGCRNGGTLDLHPQDDRFP